MFRFKYILHSMPMRVYTNRSMCFNKVIIDENAAIGLLAQLVATRWNNFKAFLWFTCLLMTISRMYNLPKISVHLQLVWSHTIIIIIIMREVNSKQQFIDADNLIDFNKYIYICISVRLYIN